MLAFSLKDDARRFYTSKLSSREKISFKLLTAALSKRYGNHKREEQYKARLSNRKRQSGESIQALADDAWCLVQRAYPQMSLDAQEVLAFDAFRNAISPDLRMKIFDKDCRTMEEAVNALEQFEALKEACRNTNRYPTVRAFQDDRPEERQSRPTDIETRVNDTLKSFLNDLDKRQSQQKTLNSFKKTVSFDDNQTRSIGLPRPTNPSTGYKPNERYASRPIREATCYECGELGHVRKNCPARWKDVTCYGCGQKGHMRRMCPQTGLQNVQGNDSPPAHQ